MEKVLLPFDHEIAAWITSNHTSCDRLILFGTDGTRETLKVGHSTAS